MQKFHSVLALSAALLFGCGISPKDDETVKALIGKLKQHYAPDRRVAIFDVTTSQAGSALLLKGEVQEAEWKKELLDGLAGNARDIIDSIAVLPEKKLGEVVWGIISVSVANMKSEPSHASELASQVLMGNVVRLWKEKRGWYYAQSPDHYLGWVEDEQFVRCGRVKADEWITARKAIVTELTDFIRQAPSASAIPVSDVVAGSLLRKVGEEGTWIRVELPDGRKGFILRNSIKDYDSWKKNTKSTPQGLEHAASSMIGVPYLWGGTSTKGVDCSGFTKTVFMLNGMQLNRDADQQAQQGAEVMPGQKFENVRKGDLLFFGRKETPEIGERITHVAIYLGDRKFINSSGMVKIESLDPASEIFNEYRLKSLLHVRRIIPESPKVAEVPLRNKQ